MRYIPLSLLLASLPLGLMAEGSKPFTFGTYTNPDGHTVQVDSYGIVMDGRHQIPVMGEIHYSRVPRQDWRRELRKMRAGGISVVSTYVFWNHHEPEPGQWCWQGNRDLRAFVQTCQDEGLPVVLRIGPFCHGEVYQGGMPDWLVEQSVGGQAADGQALPGFRLRSEAPAFMHATHELYSQIYRQVKGLLWKEGGPIIGLQIENESRGPWSYYMALRAMAIGIGFDLPFYTRTGWPKLNGREEFGKLLPLYGDYADGFWDRTLDDMPGDYRRAFVMKDARLSTVIATETFGKEELAEGNAKPQASANQYPYLTCELGGGMMPSYHRRINISGREAFPMAVCKLGSGSNLPGYYMYHGGSNAYDARHTMAECQASTVTNYNDMPHISYDFQSPLGEMGQPNEVAFHQTRWLHQYLADWGEELALMPVDSLSDHYARRGCFVFRNDYVRMLGEMGQASVTPCGMEWEGLDITSADVQPFALADGQLYFITVQAYSAPSTVKMLRRPRLEINGKQYRPSLDKPFRVGGKTLTVLSPRRAQSAYVIDGKMHYAQHGGILYRGDGGEIVEEVWRPSDAVQAETTCIREAKGLRGVKMGRQKVAEQPSEADFERAQVWSIELKAERGASIKTDRLMTMDLAPSALEEPDDYYLRIDYRGDVARLYADGVLVEDNFWNGKPMLVRIADLVRHDATGAHCKRLELKILPLGKQYPIYLQQEQRSVLEAAPGDSLLELMSVGVVRRECR